MEGETIAQRVRVSMRFTFIRDRVIFVGVRCLLLAIDVIPKQSNQSL
jgi:hypothetical protein